MDHRGEVYAIAKYVGVKTKEVQNRLGDAKELVSVPDAKAQIAGRMTGMLRGHIEDMEARFKTQSAAFAFRKSEIIGRQREERAQLKTRHAQRWERETLERSQRFRKGMRGLWDRVNGTHKKIRKQNEREASEALQRDRGEKEELIFEQLDARKLLHDQSKEMRQAHAQQITELNRDIGGYSEMAARPPALREHFEKAKEPEGSRAVARQLDIAGFDRER